MEKPSQAPQTETPAEEHRRALRLAQERNEALYQQLEAKRPNRLREAITTHVLRAQGKTALGETVVLKDQENTGPQ